VSEGFLVARRVVVAKIAAEGAVADALAAVAGLFAVPFLAELSHFRSAILAADKSHAVSVAADGVFADVVAEDAGRCGGRESGGVGGGVSGGEVGGVSGGVGGARSTGGVIVDVLDFGLGCVVPGVRYVYGDVVAGDVAVHGASAGAGGGSSVRDLDGGETDGHRDGGVLILGQVLGRVAAVVPAVDFGASTEVKTGGARVHPDAGDTLAVAATHVEHTAP